MRSSTPEGELHARVRQQEAVADLGQRALETDDPRRLMRDACEIVTETLGAEYAGVFELVPSETEAILREGVGWRDGVIGAATASTDADSHLGRALVSGDSLLVADVRTDSRFARPPLLAEHGVRSGICGVIGPADEPWGVLGAYSTDDHGFDEHDRNVLRSIATVVASAVRTTRIERRFEAIFDDPNILVGLLDPDGTVVDINETAMEYVDADLGEIVGDPFWETPWLGDDEEIQSTFERGIGRAATGEYVEFEADLEQPDGEMYAIEGVLRPVTDVDGNVVSILVSDRDVTPRVEREKRLRKVKEQFEAASEAGDIGTWEWDVSDDRLVGDASFARTFGADPVALREGVSLDRFVSAIHEDDRDRFVSAVDEAIETCGEFAVEYRVRNADGEYRWVADRGHAECDEDGTVQAFPGALTDITDRKRAELEVENQRRQLETLFEVLPVGVMVADAEGSLRRSNDTATEIWGGEVFDADSVDDYEHYTGWWAETGEPVDPDEWTMARVLSGEDVVDPDVFEIETVDGERRVIMVQGKPIRNEQGEVVRGVVVQTDITERTEYERRLEESNERLEQFAYAASHDLQEPLRMISSYLQLVESRYADALDEDGREFLEFAVDGAERMREMIDGLLAYARVETKGEPFEPVELDAVLEDALDNLRVTIEESGARISAAELPRVSGDETQLQQVFQNLLANAIEYSGEEPPRIHVEADRSGRMGAISVRDEGVGIDPADRERVFEVFQRAHGSGRYEGGGTGIGLSLCKRIVERHGGEIWVDSEPGEGATFTFTLPLSDESNR